MGREAPEPGNYARWFWPLVMGGVAYGVAASRARGWAPLAAAGVIAYGVNKAMVNQKDYVSVRVGGSPDLFPF